MKPIDISRRGFVGGAAVATGANFSVTSSKAAGTRAQINVSSDGTIQAETTTLVAKIEKGFLTSLKSKASGEEYIEDFDRKSTDALQLVYRQGEAVSVGEQKFGRIETRKVTEH